MFDNTINFFKNSWNNIENTLNSIKALLEETKSVLSTVASIIVSIIDIFGFIGFRVIVLLISTSFILSFLNMVSPTTRKINYCMAVGTVLWLAITVNMPLQVVVLKYICIILAPILITYLVKILYQNLSSIYVFIKKQMYIYISKLIHNLYNSKKNILFSNNDYISLIFSSDLPKLEEMEGAVNTLKKLDYKPIVLENEKISLLDNNKKIIFSNYSKAQQLIQSFKSRTIKLLWCWADSYSCNEIIPDLAQMKKVKQDKYIIGGGDNSYILNFLQHQWNWQVIYGNNFNKYINKKINIAKILDNKELDLAIINTSKISKEYILKTKIVGGDLSVIVSQINTEYSMHYKNKILFLDCKCENQKILYRYLLLLYQHIIKGHYPSAIVFGNVVLEDNSSPADIIKTFSKKLQMNNIYIPFFKIKNFTFIHLNRSCMISYKNNKIILS